MSHLWNGVGSDCIFVSHRGLLYHDMRLFRCCCHAPCVVTVVSRNVAGKNSARPPLKRFVSSAAWVDTEEPSVMMKG